MPSNALRADSAGPSNAKISLRHIRSLQPHQTVWDGSVSGFGVRRQSGTAISYIVSYRTRDGRQRIFTIGKHGSPWLPDTARREAQRILGEVVSGNDPMADKIARRQTITVAELCQQYLADIEAGRLLTRRLRAKKASTLVTDRGRIARHIIPLLGRLPITAVTRTDIEGFLHDVAEGATAIRLKTKKHGLANVRGGRGTASRTVGLLGAIFTYAVRQGLRSDNPVHGVMRFADERRQRRLSDDEYRFLDAGLVEALDAGVWPAAIDVTRFLMITGWRRGEALGLKWSEVDLVRKTASLTDTKTGASVRALSDRACALIQVQSQKCDLVFASKAKGPMTGYRKLWLKIAKLAGLPGDVTPHVLRHSLASLAADLGYSESTIAALIGHKLHSITNRYVHSADAVLIAAANVVADAVVALMEADDQPTAPTV